MRALARTTLLLAVAFGLPVGVDVSQAASPALAPITQPVDARPASIEPLLMMSAEVMRRRGPSAPFFGPRGADPGVLDAQGSWVLLRSEEPLDREQLLALGVRLDPRHVAGIHRAWVPWSSLALLRWQPGLRRIASGWAPRIELALAETTAQIGATQARRALASLPLDGRGQLIADIDSGVDIFHPALFFADGGAFDWIDVDGNGRLTPGLDAVDLDRDGEADRNETARLLEQVTVLSFSERELRDDDGAFDPGQDWIFVDFNRDTQRNRGLSAGFTEEDPGYGEPMLVADDVDKDGVIGPGERLWLLSTSKVRKLTTREATFRRGENLIEAGVDEVRADGLHGSAVAGILVGGQPLAHSRVGVAPGAELLVYAIGPTGDPLIQDQSVQLSFVADALEEGADIVLHEWTNPFTRAHDGSSAFEAAMDQARAQGVHQVTALGNLNTSDKHLFARLPGDATAELAVVVPPPQESLRPNQQGYEAFFGSLQWPDEAEVRRLALRLPGVLEARTIALDNSEVELADGLRARAGIERSSRGFAVLQFVVSSEEALPAGSWTFEIEPTGPLQLYGRISDYYSGWRKGVRWRDPSPGSSTLSYPSSADSAVSVAAFAGQVAGDSAFDRAVLGELRDFSGRGPRFDGQALRILAAPDDPFVPLATTPKLVGDGWGATWSWRFGGTSGAAPHVAAGLALVRQAYPELSADAIEERLITSASLPEGLQSPDVGWGFGKLDLIAALLEEPSRLEDNRPPEAVLRLELEGGMLIVDATRCNDPDGDPIELRVDFDYDGTVDDISDTPRQWRIPAPPGERWLARLEVIDGRGGVGRASARLEDVHTMEPSELDMGPEPSSPPGGACCATRPGAPVSARWHLVALVLGAWRLRRRKRG